MRNWLDHRRHIAELLVRLLIIFPLRRMQCIFFASIVCVWAIFLFWPSSGRWFNCLRGQAYFPTSCFGSVLSLMACCQTGLAGHDLVFSVHIYYCYISIIFQYGMNLDPVDTAAPCTHFLERLRGCVCVVVCVSAEGGGCRAWLV